MAKVHYTKRNEIKILGIKIFDFTSQYLEHSTDEDNEEIRDDIRLHELKGKNDTL